MWRRFAAVVGYAVEDEEQHAQRTQRPREPSHDSRVTREPPEGRASGERDALVTGFWALRRQKMCSDHNVRRTQLRPFSAIAVSHPDLIQSMYPSPLL